MGGSGSKQVQQNSNFNLQQYNRRLAESGLYTNNPMPLAHQNQHYFRENGMGAKPLKIQESSVNKIMLQFTIVKNSLSISKGSDRMVVNLKYVAKEQGEMKILFYVNQYGEEDSGVPLFQVKEELKERVEKGQGEIAVTRHVKIEPSTINNLPLQRKNNQNFFLFVIVIGNQFQKLYTYARTVNNFQDTVIIKQKVQNQGKAFLLHQVFGLSKNSQQRMCIICLMEQSDVSIFPCGHLCLCFACCGELMRTTSTCPICRKTIDSYERIKGMDNQK